MTPGLAKRVAEQTGCILRWEPMWRVWGLFHKDSDHVEPEGRWVSSGELHLFDKRQMKSAAQTAFDNYEEAKRKSAA